MSLNEFEYGLNKFLIIKEKETFEKSKTSCLDRGYEIATIDESDISKMSEIMLEFSIERIKFLLKNVASGLECYNLLINDFQNFYIEKKCSHNFDYGFKSNTLCKKAILQTKNEAKYTTQMIDTIKSPTNSILVAVFASFVIFLLIIAVWCIVKTIKNRRNNRRPEEVCFCYICQIKLKSRTFK